MSTNPETLLFDNEAGGSYPAGLYDYSELARRTPSLDAISAEDLRFYEEQGYLSIKAAFTPEETRRAIDAIIEIIMNPDDPTFHGGLFFEAAAREILPTLGPEARMDAVRKLAGFADVPGLGTLGNHPKLLAVVREILGDEPVRFQDMALLKPPHMGREKPWHQDHSYFNYESGTKIVGVWIALDEALPENGCMHLLPGRHREPIFHFKKRDWQICDTDILSRSGATAVPLPPGGALLFDGLLPHGTPHNTSGKRRRALQFHYAGTNARKIAASKRVELFGGEINGVTC